MPSSANNCVCDKKESTTKCAHMYFQHWPIDTHLSSYTSSYGVMICVDSILKLDPCYVVVFLHYPKFSNWKHHIFVSKLSIPARSSIDFYLLFSHTHFLHLYGFQLMKDCYVKLLCTAQLPAAGDVLSCVHWRASESLCFFFFFLVKLFCSVFQLVCLLWRGWNRSAAGRNIQNIWNISYYRNKKSKQRLVSVSVPCYFLMSPMVRIPWPRDSLFCF